MEIAWTRKALAQLEDALLYIANENPSAASRVAVTVEERLLLLTAHSDIGRKGLVPGTREFVFTGLPYLAVYRVTGKRIEILRFFHAAQDRPTRLS